MSHVRPYTDGGEGAIGTLDPITDEMTSQQRWELELQTKDNGNACRKCWSRPAPFGWRTCAPCRARVSAAAKASRAARL